MRRDWKEFKGVAARRIPDQIRSSINQKGEITFDLATFEKMGEPLAMFLFYEEHTQTIGLKPAHPDANNAVLVRVRHTRSNRVVRSRPFLLENGIEIDRTLRFTFPFIEDGLLILNLKTAVTCGTGSVKKVQKKQPSIRTVRASMSGLNRVLNDLDKELWIESEDRNGKPIVWYMLDSKGRKQKHVRDANGVRISQDDE